MRHWWFYNGVPELARNLVAGVTPVGAERRAEALPPMQTGETAIGWNQAAAIAAPYMREGAQLAANARQPERGLFQVRLHRSDDSQRTGTLRLLIDMRHGNVVQVFNPRAGENDDRFLATLFPLHSGQLGGSAGKYMVAALGLLPGLFFITGITTWILRRKKKFN